MDNSHDQFVVTARRIDSELECHATQSAACPTCFGDVTRGGDEPLWTWPCPCHPTLHLNCAVQLRFSSRLPRCPHCRCEWSGTSADTELENACRANGVEIACNWQRGPSQPCEFEEAAMPAEPHDLAVLCCQPFIAPDIAAGSRRMQWAPEQTYETIGQGCRRVTGWIGEWVCNLCGRTFSQNDDLLRTVRDEHCCGMDTRCRLSIDFQQGVFTWMCGQSGPLPSPVATLPSDGVASGAETPQSLVARSQVDIVDPPSFLTALPPLANEESTNSFLYCPLLLHAAGLLRPHAVAAWSGAGPWLVDVCQHLAAHAVSLTFIAQAYAELLQIACQHDVAMVQHCSRTGDAAAAHLLHELSAGQQDVDATLGLIIPGVMSSDGHVPNQLQDFLLQVFGGYRLASNLDAAATHFRNTGSWQRELSLAIDDEAGVEVSPQQHPNQTRVGVDSVVAPADPVLGCIGSTHICDVAPQARTASEPPPVVRNASNPRDVVDPSSSLVTIAALHPHACSRHNSARFGAQRRCTLCNAQIQRETQYFWCLQSCRFVACQSCFQDPAVSTVPLEQAVPPRVSEPDGDAGTSGHAQPQLTHFTRFSCISRDAYVQRVQSMIESGAFDMIGRPYLRVEGPTSWGVWLRILDSTGSAARCGRVRCGVLYHVAQNKVYFHGEEQPTREMLLPLFQAWTYASLDACPERQPGAEFVVPPNVALSLDHVEATQLAGSSSDSVPVVDESVHLGVHRAGIPSNAHGQVVHGDPAAVVPSVPVANGVPVAISPLELGTLSQLLNQIVQHQAQMQQQLSNIWECLGRGASGPLQCSSPACHENATPGCVASLCPQHCSTQQCSAHHTADRASACRGEGCHAASSPGCLVGCCGDHCSDVNCAVHFIQGSSSQQATVVRVCRRLGCSVAMSCVTGYCSNHCTSRRCACHAHRRRLSVGQGASPNHPRSVCRPVGRTCRRESCNAVVALSCRTGFCSVHCSSERCPCRCSGPPLAGQLWPQRCALAGWFLVPTVCGKLVEQVTAATIVIVVGAHAVILSPLVFLVTPLPRILLTPAGYLRAVTARSVDVCPIFAHTTAVLSPVSAAMSRHLRRANCLQAKSGRRVVACHPVTLSLPQGAALVIVLCIALVVGVVVAVRCGPLRRFLHLLHLLHPVGVAVDERKGAQHR